MRKSLKILMALLVVAVLLLAAAAAGGNYYYENYYLPELERADSAQQLSDSYDAAVELMNSENYEQAAAAFEELGDYKDSAQWVEKAKQNL